MVTFSPFLNGDRSTVLAKWYTVLPRVTVWALPASIAEMTPVAEVLVEANAAVPVASAAARASGSRILRIDGLRFWCPAPLPGGLLRHASCRRRLGTAAPMHALFANLTSAQSWRG